ncbi:dGTP triphosphohydrolase [Sorangium sp. So ce1389]|uniref:dGTP triphosphohydrolase n=1 Tax=Sorangium sp. So ce1389 TaxID=3133336 RepID=UPI003F62B879
MNWNQLMSTVRIATGGDKEAPSPDARTAFQRDWDRIIFSNAFRRLHDKTQVFPLPDDDIVHSRLTHSLEVASVGRSLGTAVGVAVRAGSGLPEGLTPEAFGDVVSAACLAHDIGNPPLGHAGEDAIGRIFRNNAEFLNGFSERQRKDLEDFEGNAQGFRVLTRLQLEEYGGLRLTAATLGAFLKYPRESGNDFASLGGASSKKFGAFQSEIHTLKEVATTLGLKTYITSTGGQGWSRHPLAYVVEAADDICNSILDIEDGVRLRHVEFEEARAALFKIAGDSPNYKADRYNMVTAPRDKLGYLRALAIGVLVKESAAVFQAHEEDLLAGRPVKPFSETIPHQAALAGLLTLAKSKCYSAREVLEIELSGYEALGGLLSRFVPVARGDAPAKKTLEDRILRSLRQATLIDKEEDPYLRLLRVTDYVSGMTDRFALSLYQRTRGISLPGRHP